MKLNLRKRKVTCSTFSKKWWSSLLHSGGAAFSLSPFGWCFFPTHFFGSGCCLHLLCGAAAFLLLWGGVCLFPKQQTPLQRTGEGRTTQERRVDSSPIQKKERRTAARPERREEGSTTQKDEEAEHHPEGEENMAKPLIRSKGERRRAPTPNRRETVSPPPSGWCCLLPLPPRLGAFVSGAFLLLLSFLWCCFLFFCGWCCVHVHVCGCLWVRWVNNNNNQQRRHLIHFWKIGCKN